MKAERARLARLQRLERVRAIAKQNAAAEAAQAESTLSQLEGLAERTRLLAADYASRREAQDAAALVQFSKFAGALQSISTSTAQDAGRARQIADGKMAELAVAERRRASVEERADKQARTIAKGSETPVLGARKAIGTPLE